MHGLVNRSIQHFLTVTYGDAFWGMVAADAQLPAAGFETMVIYDDRLTTGMVASAARWLTKPEVALWEDYGAFLVSIEPLRRLLRFAGSDFGEFLGSLEDLPDRARLAVDALTLPRVDLEWVSSSQLSIWVAPGWQGFGPTLAGILRAMADDYGALALIEHREDEGLVVVELLDRNYAKGRDFALAERVE